MSEAALGAQVGIARSYDELIDALRARAEQLRISRSSLDEIMKTLPDGYASKLLGPVPVRSLGRVSLGPMIAALGLAIVLVEDEKAMARIAGHVGTRDEKEALKATMRGRACIRWEASKMGPARRKGGKNRWLGVSKAKRRELARKAAVARWVKPPEAKPSRRTAAQ